jgi:hypothetical protein
MAIRFTTSSIASSADIWWCVAWSTGVCTMPASRIALRQSLQGVFWISMDRNEGPRLRKAVSAINLVLPTYPFRRIPGAPPGVKSFTVDTEMVQSSFYSNAPIDAIRTCADSILTPVADTLGVLRPRLSNSVSTYFMIPLDGWAVFRSAPLGDGWHSLCQRAADSSSTPKG